MDAPLPSIRAPTGKLPWRCPELGDRSLPALGTSCLQVRTVSLEDYNLLRVALCILMNVERRLEIRRGLGERRSLNYSVVALL